MKTRTSSNRDSAASALAFAWPQNYQNLLRTCCIRTVSVLYRIVLYDAPTRSWGRFESPGQKTRLDSLDSLEFSDVFGHLQVLKKENPPWLQLLPMHEWIQGIAAVPDQQP